MQALLILVAAFFIAFVICGLLLRYADVNVSVYVFAVVYGMIAALLSWMLGMAKWWKYIVGFFPLAAITVNQLNLPPGLFLAVFIVLLLLYWTTFKSQVPFYPSNQEVWDKVAELMQDKTACRLIDIGSGFGGAVLYWSQRCPSMQAEGVEVAPLPWLVSCLRAKLNRSRAVFWRKDYYQLDFKKYDVVFAYLSPAAMDALWEKAKSEMRPGTMLISYEFIVEGQQPDMIIPVADDKKYVYGWIM